MAKTAVFKQLNPAFPVVLKEIVCLKYWQVKNTRVLQKIILPFTNISQIVVQESDRAMMRSSPKSSSISVILSSLMTKNMTNLKLVYELFQEKILIICFQRRANISSLVSTLTRNV